MLARSMLEQDSCQEISAARQREFAEPMGHRHPHFRFVHPPQKFLAYKLKTLYVAYMKQIPEWHDSKIELPEHNIVVQVYDTVSRMCRIMLLTQERPHWRFGKSGYRTFEEVTHWRYLPTDMPDDDKSSNYEVCKVHLINLAQAWKFQHENGHLTPTLQLKVLNALATAESLEDEVVD